MRKAKKKAKQHKRQRRQRRQWFWITGFMPKSDQAMHGYARSRRELARNIALLFELHPKVVYVEILRFRSETDSEQKIRDDVDVHHRIKPMLAPPGMTSDGQAVH